MTERTVRRIVFVEPRSTHLHVLSRVTIPRLGSVLLGTIRRNKGYDVRVHVEDIQALAMDDVHEPGGIAARGEGGPDRPHGR